MKRLTYRSILLTGLILVVIISLLYKFYEWQTLSDLANAVNSSWLNELQETTQTNKVSDDLTTYFLSIGKDKTSTQDELLTKYTTLTGKSNLTIDEYTNYLQMLNADKAKFDALRLRASILFTPAGNFAKNFIDNQESYYNYEIYGAKRTLAEDYLLNDITQITADGIALGKFNKQTGSDTSLISSNFSLLSPLQKYTDSDFQYDHINDIRAYFPHAASSLDDYKTYYDSYYTIVKNYVGGDTQSAAYALSSLQEKQSNLNYDYSTIFSEGSDKELDNAKNEANVVLQELVLVKNFKTSNLGTYPFLPMIRFTADSLVQCQFYGYKASIYHAITNQYVVSSTSGSLITELNSISPKTTDIDSSFNKSLLTINNSDKSFQYTCKNTKSGQSFTYDLLKN